MKRMHDDKFIDQLNATASEALENANNAQSDIDNLSSVYTFAKLEISESDMDDINPYGTPEPVSLAVGDTIYENGEAVQLTAAKLEELYASNLIILSSGEDPTNHDTIAMQRQSADPLDDGADGSARFESFTVARNNSFWHWTMNVNRPDSTSGEGGGIAIACQELYTKPIYCHPIYIGNSLIGYKAGVMILDNSPTQYTLDTFKAFLDNLYASIGSRVRIVASGGCQHDGSNGTYDGDFFSLSTIEKYSENIYMINGYGTNGSKQASGNWNQLFNPTYTTIVDGVNRIN